MTQKLVSETSPQTEVIPITSTSKLPSGMWFAAYVCEPSTDGAIMDFTKTHGYPPARVYKYTNKTGRVTMFCELREEEKDE